MKSLGRLGGLLNMRHEKFFSRAPLGTLWVYKEYIRTDKEKEFYFRLLKGNVWPEGKHKIKKVK